MALASEQARIGIGRHFTSEGMHPYDEVSWEERDARLLDYRDGSVAFEQLGVQVPAGWSVNATNILAQKYFRGVLGTAEREGSLKQVADRIIDTIADWGAADGYFADGAEVDAFRDELKHLLVHQKMAFNSPVWFNIGVDGVPQQASACFILSVDDEMESILEWYAEEGRIFKGGSGAGVNLSRIRASTESLNGGGTASGPVSFMRGADASAGTIKSGGKTRRAAKMVVLDADHPDIEEFVWCKAREERKARALEAAGFDVGLDGKDSHSLQYQNANNSVRLTDDFMMAVRNDSQWGLTARTSGEVQCILPARNLLRQIAEAAWECADPGVQFDTTINHWHTAPNHGRINASNPCAEFLHVDDSACNLASLNLLKFLQETPSGDRFDVAGFLHAVGVTITAQEILVGRADYPTERIGENSRELRQLGIGFANLGALLMALGLPYDSDAGRAWAGTLTSLMTGHAYATSSRVAARIGAFPGYDRDSVAMLRVLEQHRDAVLDIDEELVPTDVLGAAQRAWDSACDSAHQNGVRNSQTSVIAPTGTIGLLMDCDTTGVEPDLGLIKYKKLVGGGTMTIVNRTIPRALRRLGYSPEQIEDIVGHIEEHNSVLEAPHLAPDHRGVFACAMGDQPIHHTGHVRMMAAIQPFVSGSISKTINMPETATIEDIEELIVEAWELGVKAVAIYRDGSKVGQPLSDKAEDSSEAVDDSEVDDRVAALVREQLAQHHGTPVREKLPRSRVSRTFEFRVADCKGFVTVGEYVDGRPGEIFVRVSKQGSTLAGIMDAFAVAVSYGLQYGVPLGAFVDAFVGMRFEPAGITDDPDVRIASSLMDYLGRRLAIEYLEPDERQALGIQTMAERSQPPLPGLELMAEAADPNLAAPSDPKSPTTLTGEVQTVTDDGPGLVMSDRGEVCMNCGSARMMRSGSCLVCGDCGTTTGCS
ncbi:MAG: vitamin B12-dependent ribonucleotide reductase [Actinomycetia bacterium]|nr:vitamin B12-dependent ribonucleotide reductase [Actinomycetes bacterium]